MMPCCSDGQREFRAGKHLTPQEKEASPAGPHVPSRRWAAQAMPPTPRVVPPSTAGSMAKAPGAEQPQEKFS